MQKEIINEKIYKLKLSATKLPFWDSLGITAKRHNKENHIILIENAALSLSTP